MNNAMLLQVCQSNSPYLDLMDISLMHHLHYCRRHQIDYQFIESDIQMRAVWFMPQTLYQRTTRQVFTNWSKLPMIQMWLAQYDYVFYVDADALIVDTSVDLRKAFRETGAGILVCRHGTTAMYNTGVVFFHKVDGLDTLMDAWLAWNPENIPPGEFEPDEQIILNRLMNDERFIGMIQQMDDRWNSTLRTNESPHPVISAWHGACDGRGVRDIALVGQWMREAFARIN